MPARVSTRREQGKEHKEVVRRDRGGIRAHLNTQKWRPFCGLKIIAANTLEPLRFMIITSPVLLVQTMPCVRHLINANITTEGPILNGQKSREESKTLIIPIKVPRLTKPCKWNDEIHFLFQWGILVSFIIGEH